MSCLAWQNCVTANKNGVTPVIERIPPQVSLIMTQVSPRL